MNIETDLWQQHIGSTWASLLTNHSINLSGIIVEVGPGFTDKIGRGLSLLQFHGTLYVLDPNEVALKWAVCRYQKLLPNARIIPVNKTAQASSALFPANVEAILMNHVLDDMILHAGLIPAEQQNVFSQIKPGESCLAQVKNTWQDLLNNPQLLEKLNQEVLTGLYNFIDHIDARIVGMSQYRSWFLSQNELLEADTMGKELLFEIVSKLGEMSIEDEFILQTFGHDPKDWLIIERENIFGASYNKQGIMQRAKSY